jgi:Cu-processing system permease protein
MRYLFFNALLCGLRARSLQVILLFGVLLVGVALMAGAFSARQPQTVVLDVGLSGIRVSLILLGLFWVNEFVSREIDRRTVFFALSYPLARAAYVWGRYFGVIVLQGLGALLLGLLLLLAVLAVGSSYDQQFPLNLGVPYWAALIGIWIDVSVVSAFAMLIATFSTVSILPLALGIAFAVASKSIGLVRDYLAGGGEGDVALVATYKPLLDIIQWVLPDMSRLDWRVWPMYSMAPSMETMAWAFLMALGYIVFMVATGVTVFSRREFF